jgi:hypothetical integral membrane protein (TIGR02206 family)
LLLVNASNSTLIAAVTSQPPGTAFNAISALAWLLVIALIVLAARRARAAGRELPVRRCIAGFALVTWVYMQVWYMTPPQRDPAVSLPLHICDIASLLMPFALLLQRRWMRAVLYFWAFGFTLMGFITPVIDTGPAHIKWWLFWLNHAIVVGGAVYDLAVLGFRPTRRDLITVLVVSVVYAAIIIPIDAATGWNYGYLGPTRPDVPTLVDVVGPWPLRIVWIALISAVILVALYLPWAVVEKCRRRSADQAG